jgi:hypothetical protein
MNISYIYLCTKCKYTQNYNCIKFNSYQDADNYYKKYYINNSEDSTIIPVCKYAPFLLHKYILNYKLSQIFINIKIC